MTRLLTIGIGGQPTGSFAGKTESVPQRLNITRLMQMGIGGRPYLGFQAKTEAEVIAIADRGPYLVNVGRGMM